MMKHQRNIITGLNRGWAIGYTERLSDDQWASLPRSDWVFAIVRHPVEIIGLPEPDRHIECLEDERVNDALERLAIK